MANSQKVIRTFLRTRTPQNAVLVYMNKSQVLAILINTLI